MFTARHGATGSTEKNTLFGGDLLQHVVGCPAKLRLDAKEVRIEQIGGALWVQPEASPGQNMAEWLAAFYETSDALPDNFLADRKDSPPQTRDWS